MIYLDNAATTFPKPEAVYQTMDLVNRHYAVNAGRGSYTLAKKAEDLIEKTREQIAMLTRVQGEAEIIFTPSATWACNQILGGLSLTKRDTVYVSPYEHNAMMRVLHLLQKQQKFVIKELAIDTDTLKLDLEKIQYQFMQNPPTILCITHISNVTGYILPIEQVADMAKFFQATVIVDGSQALGLIPVNMQGSAIDYYIFAGHKTLYGPFGIGGYIRNTGKELSTVFAGGTGSASLSLDMPLQTAGRYEPGSKNVVAIAGLHAALKELGDSGVSMQKSVEMFRRREEELYKLMRMRLRDIRNVQVYAQDGETEQSGIVSFVVDGYQSEDVGIILDEDYDIAVRCGYHCAPLIHKYLADEGYGGTVRASVGRFNTEKEIEVFCSAVEEIARG